MVYISSRRNSLNTAVMPAATHTHRRMYLSVLVCAALLLCLAAVSPAAAQNEAVIRNVTVEEAATLVEANKENTDFVVLDIRTLPEFAWGHIPGAVHIDYYSSGFRQKLNALDKSKTYLMYCHSGGRSARALSLMQSLGFTNVLHLPAGFSGWNTVGKPVE